MRWVLALLVPVLLGAGPSESRDPVKCGKVVVKRIERAQGSGGLRTFRVPRGCPVLTFEPPYSVKQWEDGIASLFRGDVLLASFGFDRQSEQARLREKDGTEQVYRRTNDGRESAWVRETDEE